MKPDRTGAEGAEPPHIPVLRVQSLTESHPKRTNFETKWWKTIKATH